MPALGQLGVAVLQGGIHHAGAGRAAAGIVVDARPHPGIGREKQGLAGVDALVQVRGIHVVGGIPGGDPVVEQVDRGADGGDPVGYDLSVGQRFRAGQCRGRLGERRFRCGSGQGFLRGGGLLGRGGQGRYGGDRQAEKGGQQDSGQAGCRAAGKMVQIHLGSSLPG